MFNLVKGFKFMECEVNLQLNLFVGICLNIEDGNRKFYHGCLLAWKKNGTILVKLLLLGYLGLKPSKPKSFQRGLGTFFKLSVGYQLKNLHKLKFGFLKFGAVKTAPIEYSALLINT